MTGNSRTNVVESTTEAVAWTAQRMNQLVGEQSGLQRKTVIVSYLRGVAFLLACVVGLFTYEGHLWQVTGITLSILLFVLFGALVWYHEWLGEYRLQLSIRIAYFRDQRARRSRDWQNVPLSDIRPLDTATTLANDLDLFGEGSVCDLVAEAHTPEGRRILASWLCEPASITEIGKRQEAVRWLSRQLQMREDFSLHGRILAERQANPDDLVAWGIQPGWLDGRRWITLSTILLSFLTLSILLSVLGSLIRPEWFMLVLALLVVHILFNALLVGNVHDIFNRVSRSAQETVYYETMFTMVWNLPADVTKFGELRRQLGASEFGFEQALRSLRWHVALSSGRRAGALSLFYFLVQILFFWDFHALIGLERWQRRYGPTLSQWFDAVGQLEALCSLAGLAASHPDWTFPVVGEEESANVFCATALGHPLLPIDHCVRNNVSVGPAGRLLLITGSNMSGKSTLLRSIGVNGVLAQAGSVICAEALRMKPIEIATSVHVSDSLAEGTSFFMAELKRLKQIVDQAHACAATKNRQLFFLLDEILQGTNSRERHLAVERILTHLMRTDSTGVVTTHDLELCHSDQLKPHCDTAHFREMFVTCDGQQQMTFDYCLRPGVCPTTNAMKLLEMIGL